MMSFVQKFYSTDCTNSGDRVFGLLGINNSNFKAKYSLTAKEVYMSVARVE